MSGPPKDKSTPESRPSGSEEPGKTPDRWGGLEAYSQLCRSLLPRVRGFAVFDARGALRWSSDAAAGEELEPLARSAPAALMAAPQSLGDLHLLAGNVPAYLFWIMDGAHRPLAIVAIACTPMGEGEAEARSFTFVHAILKPALECLRRDLLARLTVGKLKRAVAELDKVGKSGDGGGVDALTG